MSDRERFILTLEPTPTGPPVPIRLRGALKTLLRRHQLKCIDVRVSGTAAGALEAGGSLETKTGLCCYLSSATRLSGQPGGDGEHDGAARRPTR